MNKDDDLMELFLILVKLGMDPQSFLWIFLIGFLSVLSIYLELNKFRMLLSLVNVSAISGHLFYFLENMLKLGKFFPFND